MVSSFSPSLLCIRPYEIVPYLDDMVVLIPDQCLPINRLDPFRGFPGCRLDLSYDPGSGTLPCSWYLGMDHCLLGDGVSMVVLWVFRSVCWSAIYAPFFDIESHYLTSSRKNVARRGSRQVVPRSGRQNPRGRISNIYNGKMHQCDPERRPLLGSDAHV